MNATTATILAFLAGSIPITALSWRSLGSIRNHGFYRFVSWELMLWILIANIPFWFRNPLSINQLISWVLLFGSIVPVIDALYRFRVAGKINRERNDPTLFSFEHTTSLITTGVYRYIRHPMYAALMYLNWGIALKHPDSVILAFAIAASLFLFLTMKAEERENLAYFGDAYRAYRKRTKMFIPWII